MRVGVSALHLGLVSEIDALTTFTRESSVCLLFPASVCLGSPVTTGRDSMEYSS